MFADTFLTSTHSASGSHRAQINGRAKVALALAVGIGLGLRLLLFSNHHSLGIDEARLALSIAARSYAHLLPPLEHDQSAPLLFLWGERLMRDLLGVHDLVLRSMPLAAGIASVILAYPLYGRLLEQRGAIFATALTALAPTLVHYSATVKQYTVETLVTLMLVGLALSLLDNPDRRRGLLLLVAGALAVWASGPAVFVLAAIGASVALTRGSKSWLFAALLIWGTSFGLAHLLVYRHASANPYMERFWAPAFVTLTDLESLRRFSEAVGLFAWGLVMGELPPFPRQIGYVVVAGASSLILGLAIWGGLRIARNLGTNRAVLVAGPIVAAFLASAVHAYPLGVRVMVFAAPLLHVLLAGGVSAAASTLRAEQLQRIAWFAFGLLLLVYPFVGSLIRVARYSPGTEFSTLVAELGRQRQPGEALYVFAGSIPAWTFYSTDWSAPDRTRLARLNRLSRPGGPAFENAPSRGHEVRNVGDDLVSHEAAGPEILGLPSGMEFLAVLGITRDQPDPRWAANEAERITRVGSRGAWILMSEYYGPELHLFDQLEKLGGTCIGARAGSGTRLAHFEVSGMPQRESTRQSGEGQSLNDGCRLLR